MSWTKDGSTIRANYHGDRVVGVVVDSRVKLGGAVQYTILLDQPIRLRWRDELVSTLLVDQDQVEADFGVVETTSPFETVNS